MTIIFTHILPELFTAIPAKAGYALLVGFLVQITLENYSRGIEHGHAHEAASHKALMFSMIALCIHALLEGMPLSEAMIPHAHHGHEHNTLTIGIMLHKIPVAITLALLLNKSNVKTGVAIALMIAFILCTPLGSVLQWGIGQQAGTMAEEWLFLSLGLTVGILLHVSTTILFESSDHHRLTLKRIVVIMLGIGAALIT